MLQPVLFKDDLVLLTARLRIRRFAASDVTATHSWASNPQVSQFMAWQPHRDVAETADFIDACLASYKRMQPAAWAVELKGAQPGVVIGSCNFSHYSAFDERAELAYCLGPEHRGQGIATEAARAVIAHGFNAGLFRIEATCELENTASVRVLQKSGMRYEGTLRGYCKKANTRLDVAMYALTRPDFDAVL